MKTVADNTVRMRRALTEADLKRMRLPERYWSVAVDEISADVDGVSKSLKDVVVNYLSRLDEMVDRGFGVLLWGNNGRGKTGTACCLLKEARRQGYTTLFLEVAHIKSAVIGKERFDEVETLWERAHSVDVLLLDDLGKGVSDSKGFMQQLLDELIRHRAMHLKVTLLTSNISPKDMVENGEVKKSTLAMLKECVMPLHVLGKDLRDEARNEIFAEILGTN